MTPTLSDLRRLLEGGLIRGGPAIDRLPERTVEALAAASLPRSLSAMDGGLALHYHAVHMLLWWSGDERLALTDPGTAHALLVALALYLGLDSGVGALDVRWKRLPWGWMIQAGERMFRFGDRTPPMGIDGKTRCNDVMDHDIIHAPTVANEPDPIKALALAVAHVLA